MNTNNIHLDEINPLLEDIITNNRRYSKELAQEMAQKYIESQLHYEQVKERLEQIEDDELRRHFFNETKRLRKQLEEEQKPVSQRDEKETPNIHQQQLAVLSNGAVWNKEDALDMLVQEMNKQDHHTIRSQRHGFTLHEQPDHIGMKITENNPRDMRAAARSMLLLAENKSWPKTFINGGNDEFKTAVTKQALMLYASGKIQKPIEFPKGVKGLTDEEQKQIKDLQEKWKKTEELDKQLSKAMKALNVTTKEDRSKIMAMLKNDDDKQNLIRLAEQYGGKVNWMNRQGGKLHRLNVEQALNDMRLMKEDEIPSLGGIEEQCRVNTQEKKPVTEEMTHAVIPEGEKLSHEERYELGKIAMKEWDASIKEVSALSDIVTTKSDLANLKELIAANPDGFSILDIKQGLEDMRLSQNTPQPKQEEELTNSSLDASENAPLHSLDASKNKESITQDNDGFDDLDAANEAITLAATGNKPELKPKETACTFDWLEESEESEKDSLLERLTTVGDMTTAETREYTKNLDKLGAEAFRHPLADVPEGNNLLDLLTPQLANAETREYAENLTKLDEKAFKTPSVSENSIDEEDDFVGGLVMSEDKDIELFSNEINSRQSLQDKGCSKTDPKIKQKLS
ncbi:TPA: hypothetical protein ACF35N_004488 [Vibrio parahaemolyticus]